MSKPVLTEWVKMAGIPVLHVRAAGLTGPAPTIMLHHGWSSQKERQQVAAEALAIHGFRVFAPDAVRHGERDAFSSYETEEALLQFWNVVIQTVEEAGAIITAAVAEGLTDPNRIGTAGHSMGGMVAAGVMARYPWAKAGVLLNGGPCYVWLNRHYRAKAGAPVPTESEEQQLRQYDPEAQADKLAPRPLLMLHGAVDEVVPVEGVRRFEQLVRPLYADHPERLSLVEIPRLNHYVTTNMVSAMRDWFGRWLSPQTSA